MRQKFSLNELKTIVKNLVKEEMEKNTDPSYEEMFKFLKPKAKYFLSQGEERDTIKFAIHSAIYWFAATHYDGQWSNLYSIASTKSPYKPSPLENSIEDTENYAAIEMYEDLVQKFG